MTTQTKETTEDAKKHLNPNLKRKPVATLSVDGKWKSFPQVPNLLQYVSSGQYFARVKVNGKLIRRGLDTNIFTNAKLKILDFLKEERTKKHRTGAPVIFKDAREKYEQTLETDYTLSDQSKYYRRNCLKKLASSWPDLDTTEIEKITLAQCKEWANTLAMEIDDQYFNNVLGTLRAVMSVGIKFHHESGGSRFDNPALEVKRLGVKRKELRLPEQDQFFRIVSAVETAGSRHSKHCANLIRFLAFSGCRISEAKQVQWQHVDFEKGFLTVQNAKIRRGKNHSLTRLVPIIPPMRELLDKLNPESHTPVDAICGVFECEKSLTHACANLNISRITHHDLRHLFATRCIESGVDIQTVSRWLGHSDGGALAMRVYGHLRDQHSVAMAQKVTFQA